MKLCSKQKRVSFYFFITLIIFMIGCSIPGASGGGSSSTNTEEITMSGSFNIQIDPSGTVMNNSSLLNYSITPTEYTVTALDITVTYVPTGNVVGTFNWIPSAGATTYSVNISQMGEYEVKVVQTAVNNTDPNDMVTTEDSVIVNIQPMVVTIVRIVPGASLDIIIGDEGTGPTYAVFPEDFDATALDQVPSGWKAYENPQTYVGVVNNVSAHSSPNCLKLFDENDTESAAATAYIADSIYGQLSFYFMVPATPDTNSYCAIQDITGEWMVDVCFNDGKVIEIRKPDGDKIPLIDYEFDTWYKIGMNWDRSTGFIKVLINDNDYGNYQMKNPSQGIKKIRFQAGTNSEPGREATLYIDDVDLITNEETIDEPELYSTYIESPDLTIYDVIVERVGDNIRFSVDYESGLERGYSFFNPPDGSVFMYSNFTTGIYAGRHVFIIEVPVSEVIPVEQITMNFLSDEYNDLLTIKTAAFSYLLY